VAAVGINLKEQAAGAKVVRDKLTRIIVDIERLIRDAEAVSEGFSVRNPVEERPAETERFDGPSGLGRSSGAERLQEVLRGRCLPPL
jgi:hypothetical protein